MTEENSPEMTAEQAQQTIDQIKGSLSELAESMSDIERELTAQTRHEAREDKRVALIERDVAQHAEYVAVIKAHCARMEEIAIENNKSMASIAESLQVIAKTLVEEAKS